MPEFETKQYIEQNRFIDTADALLGNATDPSIGIEQSLAAGQEIIKTLNDIESGEIEVRPPLKKEQIAHYEERATTIVALGEKAISALEEAQKSSQASRARSGKGKGVKRRFAGTGSSAKS